MGEIFNVRTFSSMRLHLIDWQVFMSGFRLNGVMAFCRHCPVLAVINYLQIGGFSAFTWSWSCSLHHNIFWTKSFPVCFKSLRCSFTPLLEFLCLEILLPPWRWVLSKGLWGVWLLSVDDCQSKNKGFYYRFISFDTINFRISLCSFLSILKGPWVDRMECCEYMELSL